MSLSVDGVWKAGVWATTVWADGVWREGAPAVVEEAAATGGGKKKRRRYPRKVLAYGQVHTVYSPDEERSLYQALLDRAKTLAAIGEPDDVREAEKRIKRVIRRLEKVDDSEAQWLSRLRELDEELLILLM